MIHMLLLFSYVFLWLSIDKYNNYRDNLSLLKTLLSSYRD